MPGRRGSGDALSGVAVLFIDSYYYVYYCTTNYSTVCAVLFD